MKLPQSPGGNRSWNSVLQSHRTREILLLQKKRKKKKTNFAIFAYVSRKQWTSLKAYWKLKLKNGRLWAFWEIKHEEKTRKTLHTRDKGPGSRLCKCLLTEPSARVGKVRNLQSENDLWRSVSLLGSHLCVWKARNLFFPQSRDEEPQEGAENFCRRNNYISFEIKQTSSILIFLIPQKKTVPWKEKILKTFVRCLDIWTLPLLKIMCFPCYSCLRKRKKKGNLENFDLYIFFFLN